MLYLKSKTKCKRKQGNAEVPCAFIGTSRLGIIPWCNNL